MRYPLCLSLLAIIIAIGSFLAGPAAAQDEVWDLMTQREMKLDAFLEAHPEFNGKGVVVAVLDTGVDMGVAGLTTLPDGSVKVVDVQDFSGEGDLFWEEAHLVSDGDKGEKLIGPNGHTLTGFADKVEGAVDNRYYMALIEEKNFKDSRVKDVNGDGDSKDVFALLIFPVRIEEKGLRYEAVVDINGDGKLDDGVRLTDYHREHQSFTLAGKKGDRHQLTMALNFFPEEKRVNVHFDNGAHGTHVAGIAAGYSVHGQEGYNGGAPAAQVISLKIGNNGFSGGSTTTESVKKAYEYGAKYSKEHKVPVVFNMSFGVGSEIEGKSAVDLFVDDLLWKNPTCIAVVSNGNEGPGLSSSGTPSCAKRAIAVGALLSPEAASAQYGVPGLAKEVFFSFSSRGGDTYKPDIVAPGSACSTVPPWGDRDLMQGTSMSSPAAAGAIACLVSGLVQNDPVYPIDNGIIHRAVKNTGRALEGWNVLDYGGGVIDVPAAYEYARFLCEKKEGESLREYQVANNSGIPGQASAYWRASPVMPDPHDVMSFSVKAGFPKEMKKEAKARFYRAFDLTVDQPWLSLNKNVAYLKGSQAASIGILANVTGLKPGVHVGRVFGHRKNADRIDDKQILEFAIPVTVVIPYRVTPCNEGRILVKGDVEPGFLDRHFVEVPFGTTAMKAEIRTLDNVDGSRVSLYPYDPQGVGRGFAGASGTGTRDGSFSATGRTVYPGVWEFVVASSMRSSAKASYDLNVTLSGLDVRDPDLTFGSDTVRRRALVPVRNTQARSFRGTVEARIDGFVKREVVTVEDTDLFTRTVTVDNAMKSVSWTVDFDRETYALFTDCVLRIEDPETGKTIRNAGLGTRYSSVSVTLPADRKTPKEYKLVLLPAFTHEKDSKNWRFILTEQLAWRSGAVNFEPVSPKGGRLNLLPHDWANVEYILSGALPAAPAGYGLNGILEAKAGSETVVLKRFIW